jgi:hypothetical protein
VTSTTRRGIEVRSFWIVLAMVVTLLLAVGCGQANSPAEKKEKRQGVDAKPEATTVKPEEHKKRAEATKPQPTTTSTASASASASSAGASASASASDARPSAYTEVCRIDTYARERGMSPDQFGEQVADRMIDTNDMNVTHALDAMGVPNYPQCSTLREE